MNISQKRKDIIKTDSIK